MGKPKKIRNFVPDIVLNLYNLSHRVIVAENALFWNPLKGLKQFEAVVMKCLVIQVRACLGLVISFLPPAKYALRLLQNKTVVL